MYEGKPFDSEETQTFLKNKMMPIIADLAAKYGENGTLKLCRDYLKQIELKFTGKHVSDFDIPDLFCRSLEQRLIMAAKIFEYNETEVLPLRRMECQHEAGGKTKNSSLKQHFSLHDLKAYVSQAKSWVQYDISPTHQNN